MPSTVTALVDFYETRAAGGWSILNYAGANTAKPITTYVKIDLRRLQHEVIMVGENLGSIPPNTALMIVSAGDKRYQLYLTSDDNKNALVRFIYQKPK